MDFVENFKGYPNNFGLFLYRPGRDAGQKDTFHMMSEETQEKQRIVFFTAQKLIKGREIWQSE